MTITRDLLDTSSCWTAIPAPICGSLLKRGQYTSVCGRCCVPDIILAPSTKLICLLEDASLELVCVLSMFYCIIMEISLLVFL